MHLLIVGLVATSVSFACERCFAFAAAGHAGHIEQPASHCDSDAPASCDCPELALDQAVGKDLQATTNPLQPLKYATLALPVRLELRGGHAGGRILPGGLPAVPPLSPVRNFGIRLE